MKEEKDAGRRGIVTRMAFLATLFVLVAGGSYGGAVALRASTADSGPPAPVDRAAIPVDVPFRSGRYLLAYVFVSSECGFSTELLTKKALAEVPGSLRDEYGADYTEIAVIGVATDRVIQNGVRFLREIEGSRKVFDEISVGRSWLNEQVLRLVWREGMATPNLPQIVLVERQVDTGLYPRDIGTSRDSVVLNLTGREEIIAWVERGTPLGRTAGSRR